MAYSAVRLGHTGQEHVLGKLLGGLPAVSNAYWCSEGCTRADSGWLVQSVCPTTPHSLDSNLLLCEQALHAQRVLPVVLYKLWCQRRPAHIEDSLPEAMVRTPARADDEAEAMGRRAAAMRTMMS